MGFFKKPKAARAPVVPAGPSAEEIRTQEEAKIREEGRQALISAESRRSALRRQLVGGEDEDEEEIKRKRLFGE